MDLLRSLRFAQLALLIMMVQPVASEVIEYTDPHDKMVEVFIGIAIDARQGDVNQFRGTIQENMGYETSGQAEVLRHGSQSRDLDFLSGAGFEAGLLPDKKSEPEINEHVLPS